MRHCDFCGAALQEEAVFCGHCGRRQRKGPSPIAPAASLEETRLFRPEELWPPAPSPEPAPMEIEEMPVPAEESAQAEEAPAQDAAPTEEAGAAEPVLAEESVAVAEEAPAQDAAPMEEAGAAEPAPAETEEEFVAVAAPMEESADARAAALFGEEEPPKRRSRKLWALPGLLLEKLRQCGVEKLERELELEEAEAQPSEGFGEALYNMETEQASEASLPAAFPASEPDWIEGPAPAEAEEVPAPLAETSIAKTSIKESPQREDDYLFRLNQLVENPALEQYGRESQFPPEPEEEEEEERKTGLHWWILGGAVLLLALLLGGGLLWYHEPVRSFERAFSAGDYSQALSIYNQRAADKENKAAAIQELLNVHIAAIYQEYLDERISAADAKSQLQALNGFPFLGPHLQEADQQVEAMEGSRKAFAALEAAMAGEDYLSALDLAEQVLPEDQNYEAAQSLREQAREAQSQFMLGQAQNLLEAGNYDEAFAKINEAEALLGELPQFQAARDEAYRYISNLAMDEAAALAAQGNYSAAVSRLQSAAEYLGEEHSSEELLHKIKVYTSYIPVSLMDLSVYATDSTENDQVYRNYHLTDNQGKSYGSSLSMSAGSITYQLGGEYRSLSGVVGFPADATSTALAPSARLEIYGDGALIWASGEISGAVSPVSLWVDVQPYDKVSLKWVCTGLGLWNSWGYYATLFSPMLQPVPVE